MKAIGKYLMLLTALVALSATSCVNDELPERQDIGAGKIAALEEQAAAIEASLADIEALQTALGEGRDAGLEKSAAALEDHVAALRDAAPYMDATMATLAHQKTLAEAVGTLLASDEDGTLAKPAATLEKGVKAWLGKHLTAYYPAAVARAEAVSRMAGLDLRTQKLNVEAVLSDVYAGLSEYEDEEGLAALAAKVSGNCDEAEALAAELSALTEEVEAEYTQAVETVVSEPENFDAAALKQFNSAVYTKATEAAVTLADLIARVGECETALADILAAVESLESKVEDLEELLGMIQSVTFMSEFTEEVGVAYYDLSTTEQRTDGKYKRTPHGDIELSYIVRPAAASEAFAAADFRNDELKVLGHYAGNVAVKAIDPDTIKEFTINDVIVNTQSGLVRVKIANDLDEGFYFKETGVKMALSVATGKTDLTTKFVEVVPKDYSGTVYVESLTLSSKNIEIDNGQTAQLTASLAPEGLTTEGVRFTTSNAEVATVSGDGVITAKSVGNAVITVETKGCDEWGNMLTASCNVKVNPAIKLSGPSYVEKGGDIEIKVESPDYISPEYITWEITENAAKSYATVTRSENGSGMVHGNDLWYDTTTKEYEVITLKCTIAGALPLELTHDIRVVAKQPLGISINGMSDTDTERRTKINNNLDLNATLKPTDVDGNLFKVAYLGATDGLFKANSVGTHSVTFSIEPGGSGQYNYMYPKGKEFARNINVVVEPYYVESVTLDETFTMNVGQTATLTATFTSDVPPTAPTNPELKWTSSNPSIISVNESTGEMNALAAGTVTITATTTHANAVPSGQSHKSATCSVTAKVPTAPIAIGDFYYDDGTWSTELDNTKTVIGIVFSTVNASASDSHLQTDHSTCSNGLVIGLKQISAVQFYTGSASMKTTSNWLLNAGYTVDEDSKACGYGNTKGYKALNTAQPSGYMPITLCDKLTEYTTTAPEKSSGWYLPSYYEMKIMCENMTVINEKLSQLANCDVINTSTKYWCSSYIINYYNGSVYNTTIKAFDFSVGGWPTETTTATTQLPVRVVLAF